MSRLLSNNFINDLKAGLLAPILKRVKDDGTLMLAIREDYINIYYRGGNILRLTELKPGNAYNPFFDPKYNKTNKQLPNLPPRIQCQKDIDDCVSALPFLKEVMDLSFNKNGKPEKEFQQLVAKENNNSSISNETEYFISDIEFSETEIGARFDMLGIRWPATTSSRSSGQGCRPAFIEMKYGDNALKNGSGLISHLVDMQSLIKNKRKYNDLLSNNEKQFSQLNELGLIQCKATTSVSFDRSKPPEIIFLIANHNPRSSRLKQIIHNSKLYKFDQSEIADLRFFVSSFAGYSLHTDCMKNLQEFRELLNKEPH